MHGVARVRADVVGLVLAVLLLTPAVVSAQSAISGIVRDTSGAVLPGVTVEASSPVLIEKTRSVVTDGEGRYSIVDLRPGSYTVVFTLTGFNTFRRDGLDLPANFTMTINADLRVGALEESLTVTAEAPQVDLTTAQVGGNVSNAEISNLPNGNGNFTGLIAILPGVVYNRASDGQSDSVTINGQPGTGVVYQLDGGSNNDDLRGGSAGAQTRPALETIQEFQVVTNQFDAEYGAALSGVVNAITKQGTNSYHGSAIGFFTNAGYMRAPDPHSNP